MNRIIQLLFGILTVVFFITINLKYGIVYLVLGSVVSPFSQNEVFPLTASLAVVSFIATTLIYYKRAGIISAWYGLSITFLWLIFFEILWQNSFILTGNFMDTISSEIILISWLLMGLNSYPILNTDKISGIAFLIFGICWSLWLASGYHQINTIEGLIFNLITKAFAFMVIMVMVIPRTKLITGRFKSMQQAT